MATSSCALLSIHQCALVRSSSVPPRHWPTPGKLLHFMFLTPVGPAQRPSFCFPLSLLELHERGVTRQTCLARFWRFLCPSLPCSATSLLRGHRLATNSCNSCPSIPPPSSASLTPQFCSSPSQTRGKPHRGSSQSPRQRLTFSTGQNPKAGERSLCAVSHLASWIIVVCSFEGTFSLSHKANLRTPSRTLRTWGVS